MPGNDSQEAEFQKVYDIGLDKWWFHHTTDPLVRYLRDRRLRTSLEMIRKSRRVEPSSMSVLVVCGGVGGEGTYLMNYGFTDVTVSDFSENSLSICRQLDPRLKTMKMDAESLDVADDSFDLVLVQDGLHHLSRPTLGLTEMLRVARDCVIVIEPHLGLAGRLVGTTWEYHGESKNYVFRWNYEMLNQIVRSYLLSTTALVNVNRFFDHNLRMAEFVARFPNWSRLILAKVLYSFLKIASPFGNMMVAVILK